MKFSSLVKLFRQGSEEKDPRFLMLKTALEKQKIDLEIKSAYFILGLPFSQENLQLIKKDISVTGLKLIKEKQSFDVLLDNIDIFLVEDLHTNWSIVLLLDRYDYLLGDPIIEIIPTLEFNYDKETIFPLK
jgi:hypothetical protein